VTSRAVLVLAVLYLVVGLVLALGWGIKPQVPRSLTNGFFSLDKSNLGPLRLLHFLALAIVACRLIPRDWQGLSTPAMRCARRCGENSLPIYCLGVLLALASQLTLLEISDGLAMQIGLSLVGILVMTIAATLLNAISNKRERQPRWTQSTIMPTQRDLPLFPCHQLSDK